METDLRTVSAGASRSKADLLDCPRSAFRSLAALTIMALALLMWLPFIKQAFTVDDTNFLALAAHSRPHLMGLYNFRINWLGEEQNAFDILANPPLVPWYLAAASTIARGREWVFHLSFWPFMLLLLAGAYRLGRRFAPRQEAIWTMLWTAVAPAVVVSAHTVMPDLPLLACYVLGVALTIDAFDSDKPGFAVGGALLAGFSVLCRYNGMTVIPLLLLYAILNRVRPRTAVPAILAVLMPITVWTLISYRFYGRTHWMTIAGFETQWLDAGDLVQKTVYQLSSLALVIALTPLLILLLDRKLRRSVRYGVAVGVALTIGLAIEPWLPKRITPTAAVLLAAGMAGAGVMAVLITRNVLRAVRARVRLGDGGPEADDLFLSCWVVGTLVFNLYLMFAAVRYIMLALVPAILLLHRVLPTPRRSRSSWWLATAISFALALLLSVSDQQFAGLYRTYVKALPVSSQQRWFTGHWGFQYYMEGIGAKALSSGSPIRPGDEIVTPGYPWPQDLPHGMNLEQIGRAEISGFPGLRTITFGGAACFYSDRLAEGAMVVWLPFGISREPLDVITRWKVVSRAP